MSAASKTRSAPVLLLAVLSGLSIVQHAWYWPQLPETVASHFGPNGQPDGWMSRASATTMMCGVQIGLPLFLVTIGALTGRLPNHMINMPHRDYWLHPDRRDQSLAWMSRMLQWIALFSFAFLAFLAHLTFLANTRGGALDMTSFLSALALYLAAVLIIAGRSLWRFRLPESERRLN